MSPKMKVRLTLLAGVLIGALAMFLGLAGQDAEAPPTTFVRLIEPRVYVDNDARPCPVDAVSVAECRDGRVLEGVGEAGLPDGTHTADSSGLGDLGVGEVFVREEEFGVGVLAGCLLLPVHGSSDYGLPVT